MSGTEVVLEAQCFRGVRIRIEVKRKILGAVHVIASIRLSYRGVEPTTRRLILPMAAPVLGRVLQSSFGEPCN